MKVNRFRDIRDNDVACVDWVVAFCCVAVGIALVWLLIVCPANSVDTSNQIDLLCGNVDYLTVNSEWERYSILSMEGHILSVYGCGDSDYSLLKYAYECNCTVVVEFDYGFLSGDTCIESVSLLDCGDC